MSKSRSCPGRCNRIIPARLFACKHCTVLLPAHLRTRIAALAGKPMSDSKRVVWADGTEWLDRLVRS